ncbi:MAG TPA: hypothetical protein VII41_05530, partial [Steroidobacteraceae bacterium]
MSPRSFASRRHCKLFSAPHRPGAALALLALLFALPGCATLPNGKPDPSDRFERFNRSVYKFNTVL